MQTPFFLALNALTQALAWTVIHSLWQGILVALVAALILWLMRFRSAKARYVVAYSSLMLLLTVVVLTFFTVFSTENGRYTEGSLFVKKNGDAAVWNTLQIVGNQSFIEKIWVSIHAFLNQNAALIATAWGLGFLFFGLRLAFGWHILRGRQRRGGTPLDAKWQDILRQLQRQLSIARPIPLVEAAWAQMPLTIGWLKPMIFLPIGMVNRLNPTEVEAILAHELAHIAGRDYFFNFLQAFVEVLLYYHPAVWWLSSVIRNERELRCDDVAIQLCGGDKLAYAKMLVALQEQFEALDTPPPKLALAIGKRPSFLLRRVKRLFNSPKKESTIMEKMMITGLLLCGMFLFSFAKNGETRDVIFNKSYAFNYQDTTKPKPQATAIARLVTPEEKARLESAEGVVKPSIRIIEAKVVEVTDAAGKVSTDTFVSIDASDFESDTKISKPVDEPLLKVKPAVELDTTPTATYGRGDAPKYAQSGHCYAKCQRPNGDFEEWREVLCQHKITKDVIKTIISKLKADGCLDNSVESDEITKEIRTGIATFQTKYKLPVGNLNLETMDYLGIKL